MLTTQLFQKPGQLFPHGEDPARLGETVVPKIGTTVPGRGRPRGFEATDIRPPGVGRPTRAQGAPGPAGPVRPAPVPCRQAAEPASPRPRPCPGAAESSALPRPAKGKAPIEHQILRAPMRSPAHEPTPLPPGRSLPPRVRGKVRHRPERRRPRAARGEIRRQRQRGDHHRRAQPHRDGAELRRARPLLRSPDRPLLRASAAGRRRPLPPRGKTSACSR